MRIGLNLLYLLPGQVGGTETHAAGILEGLAALSHQHEIIVFVNEEAREWPIPTDPRFHRVVCPIQARSRARRYYYEQFRLAPLARRHGVEILHSLGYVGPLIAPMPTIVAVHDINFVVLGHLMPARRRWTLRLIVGAAVRRAAAVATGSEFSRRELVGLYPHLKCEVCVIPNAPRRRIRTAQRPPIDPPYFLAFSSTYPNKNLPRLLEAWVQARAMLPTGYRLVLVGHRPDRKDLLEAEAVDWLGYQDDATVATLLRGARALIFPSYYEGFGLPVLEAQQEGVPVAASNRSAVPEVTGDGGILFDPFSVSDMAHAIARLGNDDALCSRLAAAGRVNVSRYNWPASARILLSLYERVRSGEP